MGVETNRIINVGGFTKVQRADIVPLSSFARFAKERASPTGRLLLPILTNNAADTAHLH